MDARLLLCFALCSAHPLYQSNLPPPTYVRFVNQPSERQWLIDYEVPQELELPAMYDQWHWHIRKRWDASKRLDLTDFVPNAMDTDDKQKPRFG